ncbi:hypothetical protein [Pasteurella testudinis]|uniref:hypothetical protein n=1 Tax=Pasteurella testudinis TaxID=761 RepID=UPI004058CFC2
MTDAAIRNYELGNRSPTKNQLQMIAEALQCDISALVDHKPISNTEIYQIVFDYEKDMKFRPVVEAGTTSLISDNPDFSDFSDFSDFLIEWDEKETLQWRNV